MTPATWQIVKGVLLASAIVLVTCIVSAAIAVFFIVRIPATYFNDDDSTRSKTHWSITHWIVTVLKNLIGIVLVIAGLVMLITPGQGVLTIAIGIMLLDFPGKRKLLRSLLGRPKVLKTINNVRARFDKPPLKIDKR